MNKLRQSIHELLEWVLEVDYHELHRKTKVSIFAVRNESSNYELDSSKSNREAPLSNAK